MLELLMAALSSGDTLTVIMLLRQIPIDLLYSLDITKSNVVHYLARFNHLEALKVARDILPAEKFTELNLEKFSPFIAAVFYNHPDMVQYFRENKIDDFCSDLHRDAFLNTVKENIQVEEAAKEDAAGFLPIHYAVAAGNKEALEWLLKVTPKEKLSETFMAFFLEMAIENKHSELFPILKKDLETDQIVRMLNHYQKRFIDQIKNRNSLLEKIEEVYEHPGEVIKSLIDVNYEVARQNVIFRAVQYGCAKILTELLDGFQEDNVEARHETIDTLLHIVIQIYIAKYTHKKPNLFDKEILDIAIKACLADIEKHPEWLSTVLFIPVRSGLTQTADIFLRRLSQETKKRVLEFNLPETGMTLLHSALRYQNAETFMVLRTREGRMDFLDTRGISVQDVAARSDGNVRLSAFSPKFKILFEHQARYFDSLTEIMDEGAITQDTFSGVKKSIEGIKESTKKYDALKDDAFIHGLWKVMLKLMKHDFNNELTRTFYFFLRDEIKTIQDPSEKFKNSVPALRNSFILAEYDECINQLNTISKVKDIFNSPVLFNHANTPQFLTARMALMIFKEVKFHLPANVRRLLNSISVSSSYNMFLGVFCLHLLKVEDFTEDSFIFLYKQMSEFRLSIRKGENTDLMTRPLHKKRNLDVISSEAFIEMMQETHADISVFYRFIIELETKLWGDESGSLDDQISKEMDIEKLKRMLGFYRFKHEVLELLNLAGKEFKNAVDFSTEFARLYHVPVFTMIALSNIEKKIQHRIEVLRRTENKAQSTDIIEELLKQERKESNKLEKLQKKAVLAHVKKDAAKECKSEESPPAEEKAEELLSEEKLPRYHYPTQDNDRFLRWAENNKVEVEKIYLKKVGEKKRIPIFMPTKVLAYMRSFGSDGCWLTGGAPRDLLLGFTPKDWDFIVDRSLAELQQEFKTVEKDKPLELKGKVEGKQTLVYRHDGFVFENSPRPHDKQLKHFELRQQSNLTEEERRKLRAEITKYYFNLILEDEEKRDFPINAMAINYYSYFNKDEQRQVEIWQLIDDLGGYKDLMNRQISLPLLENATDAFWKDPIRPLRAIRHACRLGLWGADELIEVFNQGGVSLYDALFNVNENKLKDEFSKLKETFKDDLPIVLDLFKIRKVFEMRGMMPVENNKQELAHQLGLFGVKWVTGTSSANTEKMNSKRH